MMSVSPEFSEHIRKEVIKIVQNKPKNNENYQSNIAIAVKTIQS